MPANEMNVDDTSAGRSLRVFLCHASGDKPAVRELYRRLSIPGVDPWLDEENLLAGQDWEREIKNAVRNSDAVIVCLSRQSVTKEGYVRKEIQEALEVTKEKTAGTIFLIPLKLEECDVPEELRAKQWVNYFEEHGYERLMRALTERANKLGLKFTPPSSTTRYQAAVPPKLDLVLDNAPYSPSEKRTVRAAPALKPAPLGVVVRQPLPENIARLTEFSYNLAWTWEPTIKEAFRMLDPDLWRQYGHNPVALLHRISRERLEQASRSRRYVEAYTTACRALDAQALQTPETAVQPVALFCLEFGLTECLPFYSGGLGVFSGDQLKAASDSGAPMVGVGLLYRRYFRQRLNPDGWQQSQYPVIDFEELPVVPSRDASGRILKLQIPLADGPLSYQVWQTTVGRTPLYLLDSNIPENSPNHRDSTDALYGGNTIRRIRQEMLLGVGGVRALSAVGIEPAVVHLNEAFAAFAAIERIHTYRKKYDLSFQEALEVVRATTVYTTHTPVPAGVDTFDRGLVQLELANYLAETSVDFDQVFKLGQESDSSDARLSMLAFAMRTSAHRNAISRLHQLTCRGMWNRYWPGLAADDIPITYITNGVHVMSWLNSDLARLYDEYLEPDWRDHSDSFATWSRIDSIPADELIEVRDRARRRLVEFIRTRHGGTPEGGQGSLGTFRAPQELLDSKCLTIGFARRFATYKRSQLLFYDVDRLRQILSNEAMPVQLVVAGKAHPMDEPGKDLIREIIKLSKSAQFRNRIAFIEDYDLEVCRLMVQGADLWLSTSRRGLEACGTSGMKAAVNGSLNFGVLDGWFDEAFEFSAGWAIGERAPYLEDDDQSHANSMYALLENEIAPMFYNNRREWIRRMKQTLMQLTPRFTVSRTLREYSRFYDRARELQSELLAEGGRKTRERVQRLRRASECWDRVRPLELELPAESVGTGNAVNVRLRVDLADLAPEDVRVETVLGRVGLTGELEDTTVLQMVAVEKSEVGWLFSCSTVPTQTGRLGYAVRILPDAFGSQMELPCELPVKWAASAET